MKAVFGVGCEFVVGKIRWNSRQGLFMKAVFGVGFRVWSRKQQME